MALNPIPPQAYTKETLQKAYSWLLRQAPEIKEMARDQEILVSLYLKAQRSGEESLDRPSIHNFRSELKNLADMMTDLNADPHSYSSQSSNSAHSMKTSLVKSNDSSFSNSKMNDFTKQLSEQTNLNNFSKNDEELVSPQKFENKTVSFEALDDRSLQSIRLIKERFNLSSETEALRLLLAAGMEKLSS